MFEKYYTGVIEQVYDRVTSAENNIVMACYNNDFSLEKLECIRRYSQEEGDVFFAWKEYESSEIVGAYDPFLEVVFKMYRKYVNEDFDEFLTQCEVYELHREILKMYYESGICKRTESVLLDEVKYEKMRMTKTIALMLKTIAQCHPIVIVINRFHMASPSTIALVNLLLDKPAANIGIVLGANIARKSQGGTSHAWERMIEKLKDGDHLYHIGSSENNDVENHASTEVEYENYSKIFVQLNNIIELLDYEQANKYFNFIEHQVKFEEVKMRDSVRLSMYYMHVKVAILMEDISKALDLIEEITHLNVEGQEQMISYKCAYDIAVCYMYQGKLEEALGYAKMAKMEATAIGEDELIFKCDLLMAQIDMSGWHNIFFCVKDIEIEENLIERLLKYNYRNHLAHIYIYAYDNRPEAVAKAYRSEAALKYFSKGIALAKEIGNEHLVYDAYQKNVMIASTNGMNEIALLYSIRNYQYVSDDDKQALGRILSAIGYNLSALGRGAQALDFYNRAIHVFHELQLPEDIAEVCYNYALTQIARGEYHDAAIHMQMAMKIVEKLHLNSIRVCNLSKLYAIQALVAIMQGNRFDAERYLLSCSQFLNYILEKNEEEVVHDYARSDDDLCLYNFAKALLHMSEGDLEEAFLDVQKAEKYFVKAEGNLFFMTKLFRESRMEIFGKLERKEMYESEKESLHQYEELIEQLSTSVSESLLNEVSYSDYSTEQIDKKAFEELVRKEALERDNKQNKRQLQFISTWQNLLDVTDATVSNLVKNSIRVFLNQFNNDCALYVRYYNGEPKLLYNDTGLYIAQMDLSILEDAMIQHPQGFAVSKISHTFSEHREVIDVFGADDVCSIVAVPFFSNGKLRSYLITYIKMKDNWHISLDRYMLNDEDLQLYRLLFMELGHAIKRVESYAQITEMNRRLQASATTDALTGIYNRAGMYARLRDMEREYSKDDGVAVMFIDLDNFKPYNDAYGHDVGDLVLKEMAKIFQRAIGDKGFLSRYGGDEFIIITYTSEKAVLEEIAADIYKYIKEANGFTEAIEKLLGRKIEMDPKRHISCSIGIATAEKYEGESAIERIITNADDSLYKVKETGKGHYAFV